MKYLKLIIILFFIQSATAQNIYVSPNGNDHNPGTQEKPLASLQQAIRVVRDLRRLNDSSIIKGANILLQGGKYNLYEPVVIRPEDSGTTSSPTIIHAAEGQNVVLSGGIQIKDWQKVKSNVKGLPSNAIGKIWEAEVPKVGGNRLLFRQMWVNDKKAVRANNINDGLLDRILSVDKENEIVWIPKPRFNFKDMENPEFVIHQWWAIANLRVKDMKQVGDSVGVSFFQPESKIVFEHPWPAPFIDSGDTLNGNSAFYFTNSLALLNSEGEWYEDMDNGKVYYWPRKDENLNKANVIVPVLETLLKIKGNADMPVSNIQFKNIDFKYTTWLRPSFKGNVPLQAGMFLKEGYSLVEPGTNAKPTLENQAWLGRPVAGVEVEYGQFLSFENCNMEHFAATGIDFVKGTNHNQIQGCLLRDIGGTGIQIGFFGDDSFEAHLAYDPSNERVVCHHEMIVNNIVTDVTNEDWGCVGIGVGYAHDISIVHNEVSYVNYTAISLGWGWTPEISCLKNNLVKANHIHHFARMMYDVAGVYTLGAQPNSEVSENSIHDLLKAPYAHIPEHYQYLYTDEGSSYIRFKDNWTETDKFFQNCNGPGNEWINNGPQIADSIKTAAGLTEEYKYLLEKL